MTRPALTRPVRVVRARARTARQRMQHRAEVRRGAKLDARPDRIPVFVLGAPRSGTTLLYQLLVEGLDVGWLANAHMQAPGDVSRMERELRPRDGRGTSDFESSHGVTAQDWGPSEAGEFWYRFFPRYPHQVGEGDATAERTRSIRSAVRLFMGACEGSVVFKNVFNSLRIPVLARALPEARFVHIERDEAANARSLLAGRLRHGDLGTWWSAEPDGADALRDRPPAEQVVWQVRRMNEVTRAHLAELPQHRSFVLGYAELCADPRGMLERIHAWLVAGGADIDLREGAHLPERFEVREGGRLADDVERQLAAALASGPAREDVPR